MSEKPKKARAKTAKDESGVLGNLPATRASRVGGERSRAPAKPRATAAKPKAATAAKPKPKPATPRPRTAPRPTPVPPDGPRPVRAGAPALAESTDRARSEAAEPPKPSSPPTGTELVTTAIQAAGELAQIGLTVGGQVLKRAVKRLPKP